MSPAQVSPRGKSEQDQVLKAVDDRPVILVVPVLTEQRVIAFLPLLLTLTGPLRHTDRCIIISRNAGIRIIPTLIFSYAYTGAGAGTSSLPAFIIAVALVISDVLFFSRQDLSGGGGGGGAVEVMMFRRAVLRVLFSLEHRQSREPYHGSRLEGSTARFLLARRGTA